MIKNQLSREEARRAANDLQLHWLVFEQRIKRVLKANGFYVFHVPRLPTRELNKRLAGLAGLPDFIAVGKVGGPNEGRVLTIECKTGKATQDERQSVVMKAFLKVPGVSGGVFYPHDYKKLVKLAGGKEPL